MCQHEFKEYIGFTEKYEYCVHCNKKKSDVQDSVTLRVCDTATLSFTPPPPSPIVFFNQDPEIEYLRFCPNGDIFVKGKLIGNDTEVLQALREFLHLS